MTRKRILLVYLGVVLLLLMGTAIVLRETGVARSFVENLLARVLLRDAFRLGDASVDLGSGTVTLTGLEIATPASPRGRARVAVDQVVVGVDANPLGDVGRVHSVRVRGMRLELDLQSGEFPDLNALFPRGSQPAASAGAAPPVEIVDSTLVLGITRDAPPLQFSNVSLQMLPEEPGSSTVALTGTMRDPAGHLVHVEGRGDLGKPELRAQLRLEDLPLQPEIAQPYSQRAVDALAGIGLGGVARSVVLWAEYPDSRVEDDAAPRIAAGVRLDLVEVRCDVPELPYPIVGATARVAADLRDGGSLSFVVTDESVDGDLELRGTTSGLLGDAPRVDVEVHANDVLVGPVLQRALARLEPARLVFDAFRPSGGRASAIVRFTSATPERDERFFLELELGGIGAQFVGFEAEDGTREFGFPAPLRDVRGRIRVVDGEVEIEGVTAKLEDRELSVKGHVVPGGEQATRVELDLHGDELPFSPAIRDALEVCDAGFAATYDEYAPQGSSAVDLSIRSGPDLAATGVHLRLRPIGASASWSGFPVRVEQITGSLDIGTDGVVLDLHGAHDESTIALAGRFPAIPDPAATPAEPAALLRVSATDLAIDRELRAAMPALSDELHRTVEFLDATGRGDLELDTWRAAGSDTFAYDVRFDLRGGSIRLERLPIPTHDLTGPVFVHGDGGASRIELGAVHGIIENGAGRPGSPLLVQGVVDAADGDYECDLTAVVRGLELNERLGNAMHTFGAFDLATWNVLRPAGTVDVVWRQTKALREPEPHQSLRIQLLDVESDAAFLPATARHIYGDVRVDDGVARFRDVRATIADAAVYCREGSEEFDGRETRFHAVVDSDDFPVDDRLANLLDGPLKQTYLEREVRGRVRIHELSMLLHFPQEGTGFRSELSGEITALGLRLVLGSEVTDVTGSWTIDRADLDSGGGAVEGRVSAGSATVFGHRMTDVAASFDANSETVRFWQIAGRLHGGEVHGTGTARNDLVYRLGDPGTLALDLGWSGLSLSELVKASGVENQRYRGSLSGALRLDELVGTDIVNARGAGELRIAQGDLGRVPVFTAIYSYLSEPRRPKFETLDLRFTIADQRTRIDSFEVSSPLLSASGSGWIDMDGYVDVRIDFPDFFGKSADWTFLPQMLRMLTNHLAQFQVYGYLRSPKIEPLWLWRDPAGRIPLQPIPARSQIAPRTQ